MVANNIPLIGAMQRILVDNYNMFLFLQRVHILKVINKLQKEHEERMQEEFRKSLEM